MHSRHKAQPSQVNLRVCSHEVWCLLFVLFMSLPQSRRGYLFRPSPNSVIKVSLSLGRRGSFAPEIRQDLAR
jgi:hypothetical protein